MAYLSDNIIDMKLIISKKNTTIYCSAFFLQLLSRTLKPSCQQWYKFLIILYSRMKSVFYAKVFQALGARHFDITRWRTFFIRRTTPIHWRSLCKAWFVLKLTVVLTLTGQTMSQEVIFAEKEFAQTFQWYEVKLFAKFIATLFTQIWKFHFLTK